jgi:BolA protein
MNVSAELIEQRLRQALHPEHLRVIDESAAHAGHVGANGSGQGTHFRVLIGDAAFDKLTRVARHRLVYDALQDLMDQGVHALAIEVVPCDQ